MTKINILTTIIISLFIRGSVFSQNTNKCGTTAMYQKLLDENPHLLQEIVKSQHELEEHTQKFIKDKNNKKSAAIIYVIPVVFHIVHNNGPENIPDAQVFDAVRILNEDFRKFNADSIEVIQDFKPIIGDGDIEFRLAQKDPSGFSTNGIDRIVSTETYVGDYGSMLNPWPRDMYLNIWVCAEANGAAGWTNLPPSVNLSPSIDGIVVRSDYVGNYYRTLTHETGHWINLYHTWGPGNDAGNAGNCSIDDEVFDTPNTIGGFGCDLSRNTCSSLDNVQNYMDYGSCDRMFTEGQIARMRAALTSPVSQRNNLWTSSNLTATGTNNSAAVFFASTKNFCAGVSINFNDQSYNAITSWNWTFPGGIPSTSNLKNPAVTYNTPGIYDVSLTVTNTSGSYNTTKISYINVMVPQAVPFLESFESVTIPGNKWEIINNDNGNTWELTTAASYSGSTSLKMNNYSSNTAGQIDEAIYSIIDLSVMNSAQFTFKAAYAQKNSSTNDVLWTYISNDCGNTWINLVVKSGSSLSSVGYRTSAFIPADTSEWNEISVAIGAAYLTENFRFKFKFISAEGNNLYIDDINIDGVYKPIPILVSPPNYSTGIPINVTLDWNAVGGVAYHQYEIDTSLLFSSPLLVSGTKQYISSTNDNPDTEEELTNLDTGTTYYWRVRAIAGPDTLGWSYVWRFTTGSTVGIEDYAASNLNLLIFPNPIESYSVIYFNLHKSQYVTLKVYDILGREILNLADEKLDAGTYRFETKGIHFGCAQCRENPGIYIVKLTVGEKVFTKKIIWFGSAHH